METRAFRIDWPPGTHVYEIDQTDVLDEKEWVLKGKLPRCTRHAIKADLKEMQWVDHLIKLGFRPAEPSLWLLEGVLYYLTPTEVDNLLNGINTITPKGSWLGADVINTFLLHGSDDWARYWQSSCDDPESFFHAYGWKASAIQPGEEGASYGRFTFQFADRAVTEAPHIFFLIASKQA